MFHKFKGFPLLLGSDNKTKNYKIVEQAEQRTHFILKHRVAKILNFPRHTFEYEVFFLLSVMSFVKFMAGNEQTKWKILLAKRPEIIM